MTDSLTPFLPTVERARQEFVNFPLDEPRSVERLAMLVVHAALVRRTSFAENAHVNVSNVSRGEPPPPNDFEQHHYVRIDGDVGGASACMACLEKPGQRRCRVCNGLGTLFGMRPCSCNGGWIICPTCNGSATTSAVKLRYYTDTPAFLVEAYMPTHVGIASSLFRLESQMEEDIQYQRPMPEEMRCHDLTGRVQGTAYRGGGRVVQPDFHGHSFGDTIDKALAGLTAVGAGANVVRYEVRAYAWPFLKVELPSHAPIAIYTDRFGGIKVFGFQAT